LRATTLSQREREREVNCQSFSLREKAVKGKQRLRKSRMRVI